MRSKPAATIWRLFCRERAPLICCASTAAKPCRDSRRRSSATLWPKKRREARKPLLKKRSRLTRRPRRIGQQRPARCACDPFSDFLIQLRHGPSPPQRPFKRYARQRADWRRPHARLGGWAVGQSTDRGEFVLPFGR